MQDLFCHDSLDFKSEIHFQINNIITLAQY